MGAGRGTRRRAAASSKPLKRRDAVDAWHKFAGEHGILNQSITSYYGINGKGGGYISSQDSLKLAEEFFHDLVAAGAILLPSGASIGDYKMSLHKRSIPPHSDSVVIEKSGGKKPASNVIGNAERAFTASDKMFSWEAQRVVRNIFTALQKL
jgi:hypothetical protein